MVSRGCSPTILVGLDEPKSSVGTEVFFTVPIGKSFHVYSAKKLQNVMSSSQLSEDIT